LEVSSQLKDGSIADIAWAKKEDRRKPHQKTAHAIVSFNTREAANQVIQKGMSIGGKWVFGHRDQKDPQRFMKCQQYGHITRECTLEKDVCGQCGDDHQTSDCMAAVENFHCTVCKQHDHTAADRRCLTLLQKIWECTQRNPEAGYRLFIMDHLDTWIRD
ncbi:hypothetical protein BT96DRAFT_746401, partial [Gymnopus androsaceus JB14]